ncbi:hypothetical protein C8J56DRAFT_1115165 [Mycena floridula]|nr:hypothetical protein C8J56DRAFT_1115165 [Mycena floridula]
MTLILKVFLLVIDAVAMRISSRPPPRPVEAPAVVPIVPDWRERFLQSLGPPCMLLRALSWTVGFIEIAVILASYNPSGPISNTILRSFNLECPSKLQIKPNFLIGIFLTITGTLLRVNCYRTLGRMFTFELSIQRDHMLVVDGVYGILRHPSYTGLILTILGSICSNSRGSWIAECGFFETWLGKSLVLYWLTVALAVILSLFLRLENEESLLRKQFGAQWEEWAAVVRYKLIPGVF